MQVYAVKMEIEFGSNLRGLVGSLAVNAMGMMEEIISLNESAASRGAVQVRYMHCINLYGRGLPRATTRPTARSVGGRKEGEKKQPLCD